MIRRLKLVLLFACCNLFAADPLPIGVIAHIGFRVADLEKTRDFYATHLHLQQAFDLKNAAGKTTLIVLKINDDQFLEFNPGPPVGFTHVAFLTQKLEALRTLIESLGLNPPEERTGTDRTRNFSIKDPDSHRVEFVEYEPDSKQAESHGKFDGDIVTRVNHIALPVANRDASVAFFQGKLGLQHSVELLPAGDPVHLSLEVRKGAGAPEHDPDGLSIELKTSSR